MPHTTKNVSKDPGPLGVRDITQRENPKISCYFFLKAFLILLMNICSLFLTVFWSENQTICSCLTGGRTAGAGFCRSMEVYGYMTGAEYEPILCLHPL